MPFDKVDTQIDFPAQERAVLEFWQRIDAFNKLREKNLTDPKFKSRARGFRRRAASEPNSESPTSPPPLPRGDEGGSPSEPRP